jgi:secondary thiamine-phosphate synthase enzyme
MVPESGFKHFEGNSDSHTKTLLTDSQFNVINDDSRFVLGTWQSVYFAEFDEPRHRKIHIKIFKG